jgi:hypothetical protein
VVSAPPHKYHNQSCELTEICLRFEIPVGMLMTRSRYPSFVIRDGASGRAVPYTGSFRLTVVAGGPSYRAMRDYSPQEQAAYSMWPEALPGAAKLGPPSHPVFGFLEAEEMAYPTRSGRSELTEIYLPLGRGAPRSGRGASPGLEAG